MRTSRTVPLSSLALATLALACGRVTLHEPAEPVFAEHEPNDDRWHANVLGTLHEQESIVVQGHVGPGWIDPQDGFALFAGASAPVHVRLLAADPYADLDLCVYDPVRDELVLCFASPAASEQGEFLMLGGGGEFQLVVGAFAGASAWRLEIESGCSCALALHAPMQASVRAAEVEDAPVTRERDARGAVLLERWRAARASAATGDSPLALELAGYALELGPEGARLHSVVELVSARGNVPAQRFVLAAD